MSKENETNKKETEEKIEPKRIESIIETATKQLLEDIIDDVRNEMTFNVNDLEVYLLGLEVLNHLYDALRDNNLDRMVEIEYIYRNKGLFVLQEELNK